MKDLYVHIGLHKTGTTSLQNFFLKNLEFYKHNGLDYYISLTRPNNGSEVAYLILRPGIPPDEDLTKVKTYVHDFIEKSKCQRLLIIAEAFSYLRTNAECQAMKELLSVGETKITIIVVWREKRDWWASFLNQMRKNDSMGPRPIGETTYLDPEGWLTDFETLRRAIFENFDNVIELQYEKNMISAFCAALALPLPPNYAEIRENRSQSLLLLKFKSAPRRFYAAFLSETPIGRAKRIFFPNRLKAKRIQKESSRGP